MVGNLAIEAEATEQSVCKIKVDLVAKAALRSNAHAIAHKQHADHQFGIDRGAAGAAVERL
jgi:hypothetical protein